jgi:hypothetical protein
MSDVKQLARDVGPWIVYRPKGEDTYRIGTDDGTQRCIASGLSFDVAVQIVDDHQIVCGFCDLRISGTPNIVDIDGTVYQRAPL